MAFKYYDSQHNLYTYTPEETQAMKDSLSDSNGNVTIKFSNGQTKTFKFDDIANMENFSSSVFTGANFIDKSGNEISADKALPAPKEYQAEQDYIKNNLKPDGTIIVKDANGKEYTTTPQGYMANKGAGWTIPTLNKGKDEDISKLTLDEIIEKYPDRIPGLQISDQWKKDQAQFADYDKQIKDINFSINDTKTFNKNEGDRDIILKQLQEKLDSVNAAKQNLLDSEKRDGVYKYWDNNEKAFVPENAINTYIGERYKDFLPKGDSSNDNGYGKGSGNEFNQLGGLTSDEFMKKIYDQLIPTYSEQVKNESGPALMDAYSKSLEQQYGKDYKTTLENAAARGMSTSGTTGQQLADLLANKNLNIQNKEGQINDNLQAYLESLTKNGYNTAMQNYSQELMDEFTKSGQNWDDFYNANQTDINNKLNEQAAQTGVDFTQYQNDQNSANQDYQDQLNAISNLFQAGGSAAGSTAYNYTNQSSTPVTAAVMPYYTQNTTSDGLSNNTANTLNTNPSTGKTYDLYSGNNYLGY
jgi:hypothetical protein